MEATSISLSSTIVTSIPTRRSRINGPMQVLWMATIQLSVNCYQFPSPFIAVTFFHLALLSVSLFCLSVRQAYLRVSFSHSSMLFPLLALRSGGPASREMWGSATELWVFVLRLLHALLVSMGLEGVEGILSS